MNLFEIFQVTKIYAQSGGSSMPPPKGAGTSTTGTGSTAGSTGTTGGSSMPPPSGYEPPTTGGDAPGSAELMNPLGGAGITNISDFIARLLEIVVLIGIPIVAFFIIYTGFKFVTAQGNSTKIEEAKQMLLYTIIGAFLVLGAFVLAEAIGGTVRELAT